MSEFRISYPKKNKINFFLYRCRKILKWIMIFAAIICPIVNYETGGKPWSIVAIWGIIFFWKTFLSPDVLEFSALSTVFRFSSNSIILLVLIGVFLSPGWLGFVLPIVGFGTLILSAILFLINFSKHKTDAMPLIFETLVALVSYIIVRYVTGLVNWPMIVMGSIALFFTITGIIAFHKNIGNEIVKRFHTR